MLSPAILHCDWTFTFISMSTHTRHRIKITTFFFSPHWSRVATYFVHHNLLRSLKAPKWNDCQWRESESEGFLQLIKDMAAPTLSFNERRRAGAEGKRHKDLSEKSAGSKLGYRKLTLKGFDFLQMLLARHTGLRSVCGLVHTYVGIFKNAEVVLASGVK